MSVWQTEVAPLLGPDAGVARGKGPRSHVPRYVPRSGRRSCHRKNFPATFPANDITKVFSLFERVATKDGDCPEGLVLGLGEWACLCMGSMDSSRPMRFVGGDSRDGTMASKNPSHSRLVVFAGTWIRLCCPDG